MSTKRPSLVQTILMELGYKPVKRQSFTKEELQEVLLTIRTLKTSKTGRKSRV